MVAAALVLVCGAPAAAECSCGPAEGWRPHGGGRRPRRPGRAGARSAGPNLKEWLREQFCDHPLEHCEDTRLHDAAYVGDLQTLRSLLQEESYRSRINEKSVWCCGWLPCTPLRIAATAGHGNCVDFLIRKGAEVDLVDVKGQTALYVAVVNGHLESAQILLEAGADPNGSRHHRSTPVYHASRVGRADILKALIRSDCGDPLRLLGLQPPSLPGFPVCFPLALKLALLEDILFSLFKELLLRLISFLIFPTN